MPDAKHVVANITSIVEDFKLLPKVGDEERMVGTKEALRLLLPAIVDLQRKGYAIEKITEKLAERGLVVSKATLRAHLRGLKKKRKAVPARKTDGPARVPARAPIGTSVGSAAAPAGPAAPKEVAAESGAARPETLTAGSAGGRREPHPAVTRQS